MNDDLIDFFQRSIAARSDMAQRLTPAIGSASAAMVKVLLETGRIYVCGNAESVAIAQLMTSQLVTRYEFERPSLPALCLNENALMESSLSQYLEPSERYSHLLKALGAPGDLLLLFSVGEISSSNQALVASAHEKGMSVICCYTQNSGDTEQSLLQASDHELLLPGNSKAIALDSLLFVSQTLNALIDHHLFGSEL